MGCSSMPRRLVIAFQMSDVNWDPRSEVILFGTPKRATQFWLKALATVMVSMSLIGTASGQRVNRSMIVSRYLGFGKRANQVYVDMFEALGGRCEGLERCLDVGLDF